MPITDALFLTMVVAAFVMFGAVLAWGEYRTRHFRRPTSDNKAATSHTPKAAAPAQPGLHVVKSQDRHAA